MARNASLYALGLRTPRHLMSLFTTWRITSFLKMSWLKGFGGSSINLRPWSPCPSFTIKEMRCAKTGCRTDCMVQEAPGENKSRAPLNWNIQAKHKFHPLGSRYLEWRYLVIWFRMMFPKHIKFLIYYGCHFCIIESITHNGNLSSVWGKEFHIYISSPKWVKNIPIWGTF